MSTPEFDPEKAPANEKQKEMWTEPQKGGKGRPVNKDRFISKM